MTVNIARCPEHGLHGQRIECHVCGGPVEQVPMVPAAAVIELLLVIGATRVHHDFGRFDIQVDANDWDAIRLAAHTVRETLR